jgi:hypothetical protein
VRIFSALPQRRAQVALVAEGLAVLTASLARLEQPILVVVEVAVLAGLVPDKLVMVEQVAQA